MSSLADLLVDVHPADQAEDVVHVVGVLELGAQGDHCFFQAPLAIAEARHVGGGCFVQGDAVLVVAGIGAEVAGYAAETLAVYKEGVRVGGVTVNGLMLDKGHQGVQAADALPLGRVFRFPDSVGVSTFVDQVEVAVVFQGFGVFGLIGQGGVLSMASFRKLLCFPLLYLFLYCGLRRTSEVCGWGDVAGRVKPGRGSAG